MSFALLAQQPDAVRHAMLLAQSTSVAAEGVRDAIERVWRSARHGKDGAWEARSLWETLTMHAPLAARCLADVTSEFELSPDGHLSEGDALVKRVRILFEDARAFFSEVYDARNRIVHQGELGRLHGRDAPMHIDVLVPPLLGLAEMVIRELADAGADDLRRSWADLHLRALDLATAERMKGMDVREFVALLGA